MENVFPRYTDSSGVFPSFPIVQHNCLGSCDDFLSLFDSFTILPHPPLLVAIQDPPLDFRFYRPSRDLCPSPLPLLAAHE